MTFRVEHAADLFGLFLLVSLIERGKTLKLSSQPSISFVDMQLNPMTKSGWDATKQKQCTDGHTGDIQETFQG